MEHLKMRCEIHSSFYSGCLCSSVYCYMCHELGSKTYIYECVLFCLFSRFCSTYKNWIHAYLLLISKYTYYTIRTEKNGKKRKAEFVQEPKQVHRRCGNWENINFSHGTQIMVSPTVGKYFESTDCVCVYSVRVYVYVCMHHK